MSAANQADSYKRMVNKDFVFGVEKVWLLAPSRHGAHNWEGPGELTSMSALENLAMLTQAAVSWLGKAANPEIVIFAGHSMGGHGAWYIFFSIQCFKTLKKFFFLSLVRESQGNFIIYVLA